jgi:branched-chain amino acid transport system ATP-binding protein
VKSLREDGMTVLFVEHDMDMVRDISDWVVVMAQGRIIAEGTPDEIMANPAVIDAYLGAHHDAALTPEEEQRQIEAAEAELSGPGLSGPGLSGPGLSGPGLSGPGLPAAVPEERR